MQCKVYMQTYKISLRNKKIKSLYADLQNIIKKQENQYQDGTK